MTKDIVIVRGGHAHVHVLTDLAMRVGPPLADNLHRRARGVRIKAWPPQRRHLALISTGERYAVASCGILKAGGACLWTIKDWIDRRWMRTYQDFEAP